MLLDEIKKLFALKSFATYTLAEVFTVLINQYAALRLACRFFVPIAMLLHASIAFTESTAGDEDEDLMSEILVTAT
ncbi:MAG: hypothetical protein HKO07_06645, partial [Pseudomonadales bacterium]|nr:hypothetical protein [Pseudomonadales bacterium]